MQLSSAYRVEQKKNYDINDPTLKHTENPETFNLDNENPHFGSLRKAALPSRHGRKPKNKKGTDAHTQKKGLPERLLRLRFLARFDAIRVASSFSTRN